MCQKRKKKKLTCDPLSLLHHIDIILLFTRHILPITYRETFFLAEQTISTATEGLWQEQQPAEREHWHYQRTCRGEMLAMVVFARGVQRAHSISQENLISQAQRAQHELKREQKHNFLFLFTSSFYSPFILEEGENAVQNLQFIRWKKKE